MHVALRISNETVLMGCDASSVFGPPCQVGNNISISINASDEAEARKLFGLLSEGGEVFMPLDRTFWGALFGMFADKYQIHWMISYEYEQSE